MSRVVSVQIHSSQFPDQVQRDLVESFRSRQVNHKFHYDSIKQTQKWLALHQAFSPSRTDANCAEIYDTSFVSAVAQISAPKIHLIGLGCGGGQKDTRLLKQLQQRTRNIFYTPSDVSVAMVLVAQQTATSIVAQENCFPFVCDLASAEDLDQTLFANVASDAARLVTFFGMIPNFEPQNILPKLTRLLRPEDWMLFSANLAPGDNYSAGMEEILPLYDNALTRDWLETFLLDSGVEKSEGELHFKIENCPAGTDLKRVAAYFVFSKNTRIEISGETFEFKPQETIRLFFSYRHTADKIRALLNENGISVLDQWIPDSREEGVFLCRKMS